ncbi:hypothetical protein BV25DRAFT_1922298 [Artomyces pyxidatus]|uniref:Uncharacterized protein n=1 Tax=Artomyces pyxidatus TaxID=48021 RepID=A0ACB8SFQ0_9AGAM|nr:hypothetical protein BV25DRAFT_1922298 [Artomyces pyxidatus]
MIKRWNGKFFVRETLSAIGLEVQLGHPVGEPCLLPRRGHKNFIIVDVDGIHRATVNFCGCRGIPRRLQMLQAEWWPATPLDPQTGATIAVLRLFQRLKLESKITVYDFWNTLVAATDPMGKMGIPNRLSSFMMMAREFSHIQMLKRGGVGHQAAGIAGCAEGCLAMVCPLCPQPGVNLPDGWESESKSWLYRPLFAIDANFRLKNRLRSSDEKDPGLSTGLAYFVENEKYLAHVVNYATQEDISTCTGFAALLNANLKKSHGLRVTGVGAIICCRHSWWQANGVGDLQKGERYCNIDYIVFNVLHNKEYQEIVLSYDIACQWGKTLEARMNVLPPHIRSPFSPTSFDLAVPKFHLPAHTDKCHAPYSYNYKIGVGRTDGEAIERNWSYLNGAASSTKEMGPGARHDTLDDFCGYWNWKKTVGMGEFLKGKWLEAISEAEAHVSAFVEYDGVVRCDRLHDVKQWESMMEAWYLDKSKPCPFEPSMPKVTVSNIRLSLAIAESEAMEGNGPIFQQSPSELLLFGINLSETQRALAVDVAAHRLPTPSQLALFQERRNELLKKIRKFYTGMQAHMAAVLPQDVNSIESTPEAPCEKFNLVFPSSLDTAARSRVCSPSIGDVEASLRYAEACEALDKIRHNLRLKTYFNRFKTAQVTGQRQQTRARTFQDRVDGKLRLLATRYRVARGAYLRLKGPGVWETTLQVLADEDIRGLGDVVIKDSESREAHRYQELNKRFKDRPKSALFTGEGRRKISWIWYTIGVVDDGKEDLGLHDDLRMEWARAKARAARWQEEIWHVKEEMRRGPVTLNQLANAWEDFATQALEGSSGNQEGRAAYAFEQANIRRQMASRLEAQWQKLCDGVPWERLASTPLDGSAWSEASSLDDEVGGSRSQPQPSTILTDDCEDDGQDDDVNYDEDGEERARW